MFLSHLLANVIALSAIITILAVAVLVAGRTWNLNRIRGRVTRRVAAAALACQPRADRTHTDKLSDLGALPPTRRWEPAAHTRLMRHLLTLTTADGTRVEVQPGATIGRGPKATIHVEGFEVSRTHTTFTLTPTGWAVVDAGSTNGTYLNGHQVGDDGALLANGDVLTLGVGGPAFHVALTAVVSSSR